MHCDNINGDIREHLGIIFLIFSFLDLKSMNFIYIRKLFKWFDILFSLHIGQYSIENRFIFFFTWYFLSVNMRWFKKKKKYTP